MVFFHNINPGARIQVRWRGEIENGTIRYAGGLVAKDGECVGIELDNRGKCFEKTFWNKPYKLVNRCIKPRNY